MKKGKLRDKGSLTKANLLLDKDLPPEHYDSFLSVDDISGLVDGEDNNSEEHIEQENNFIDDDIMDNFFLDDIDLGYDDSIGPEGFCYSCDNYGPIDFNSLCDECGRKVERDLIRQRDWDYTVSGYLLKQEERERLRTQVIKEYGKKLELLQENLKHKKKRKRKTKKNNKIKSVK
jgi:hypothetical protein